MLSADLFQLTYFVSYALIVATEELSYRHNDIYLCSAVFYSQCSLSHLDLYKCLRRRETARNAGYFHAIDLQRFADNLCKAWINADCSNVGKVSVSFVKLVYAFCEGKHALF